MSNIFAYTAIGSCYPAYLSVNRTADGRLELAVRARHKPEGESEFPFPMPGASARIVLPAEEEKALLDALNQMARGDEQRKTA